MRFGSTSVRQWVKEWRASDWEEIDPLHHTRQCPRCKADVSGGKAWRAHDTWHDEVDALFEVVQLMARALKLAAAGDSAAARALLARLREEGGGGGEDPEAAPLSGYVLGSGPLPEEMRGGGE